MKHAYLIVLALGLVGCKEDAIRTYQPKKTIYEDGSTVFDLRGIEGCKVQTSANTKIITWSCYDAQSSTLYAAQYSWESCRQDK